MKVRADKFLWCIRLYKTRKLSNDACNKSKIKINNQTIKPSYLMKVNDVIEVRKKIIKLKIQVKELINKRLNPKVLSNYVLDITPESEKIKLKIDSMSSTVYREKGKGRPTKKERRDMMKDLDEYFKF